MALGDRHADRHRHALAQRPGGHFDPGSSKFSGCPARRAAELAEVLDVVDRRPLVAGQVEQGVDQHRAVAGRQDEAVAVGPVRIGRVELQMPGEQARSRHRPCPSACPGWPLLAASTASIARARMALARRRWVGCMRLRRSGSAPAREFRPTMRRPLAGEPSASTRVVGACPRLAELCVARAHGRRRPFTQRWTAPNARSQRIERALADAGSRRQAATRSFAPRCAKRSPSSTS